MAEESGISMTRSGLKPAQVLVLTEMLIPADGSIVFRKGRWGAISYSLASHGLCLRRLEQENRKWYMLWCVIGSAPEHV